jgi:hypothetical protein
MQWPEDKSQDNACQGQHALKLLCLIHSDEREISAGKNAKQNFHAALRTNSQIAGVPVDHPCTTAHESRALNKSNPCQILQPAVVVDSPQTGAAEQ